MALPPSIIRGVRLALLDGQNAGRFLGERYRNTIIRAVNSLLNLKVVIRKSDGTSVDADVKQTELATVITIPSTSSSDSGSTSVSRYRVKLDHGSCLECVEWDGTTEGSTVFVAKPPLLRRALLTAVKLGITYTFGYTVDTESYSFSYLVRTSSGTDGTLETQDITPPYLYNDEIYAASITETTLDTKTVTAIDLNIDARAWATR